MGHGDEIAIVDGNYPASAHGNRVIRADGLNVPAMLEAVLSILPIDHFVDNAIFRAVNSRSPNIPDPVHKEMEQVCNTLCPTVPVKTLLADTFYTRVKNTYAIVATSEDNPVDIINAMIEILVKESFELPGFSTLNKLANRARAKTLDTLFFTIFKGLSLETQLILNDLLTTKNEDGLTRWQELKKEPQKPTTQNIAEYR